jgi:hypothetical protein
LIPTLFFDNLYLLAIAPVVILALRLFISRPIVTGLYLIYTVGLIGYFAKATHPIAYFLPTFKLLSHFSAPTLALPTEFGIAPPASMFFCKLLWAYAVLRFRRDPYVLFWIALDSAVSFLLCARDIATFLFCWQCLSLMGLGWFAVKSERSDDSDSEVLLRMAGVTAVGFGTLHMGISLTNTAMTVMGILVLGAGLLFQTLLNFRSDTRRMLLVGLVAYTLPAVFLMTRIDGLSDNEGLAFLPTVLLFFAGICTTFSRRVENILGLSCIAAVSLCALAMVLGRALPPFYTSVLLAPFGFLFVLLCAQPSYLSPPSDSWIRALPRFSERCLAAFSLVSLIVLLGTIPLGAGNFPLRNLLATSILNSVLTCIGTVAMVGTLFSTLTGVWFSDRFWKWPQRSLNA